MCPIVAVWRMISLNSNSKRRCRVLFRRRVAAPKVR
jgi:hypothetical protein